MGGCRGILVGVASGGVCGNEVKWRSSECNTRDCRSTKWEGWDEVGYDVQWSGIGVVVTGWV